MICVVGTDSRFGATMLIQVPVVACVGVIGSKSPFVSSTGFVGSVVTCVASLLDSLAHVAGGVGMENPVDRCWVGVDGPGSGMVSHCLG